MQWRRVEGRVNSGYIFIACLYCSALSNGSVLKKNIPKKRQNDNWKVDFRHFWLSSIRLVNAIKVFTSISHFYLLPFLPLSSPFGNYSHAFPSYFFPQSHNAISLGLVTLLHQKSSQVYVLITHFEWQTQFKGWHSEKEMRRCVLIFWDPHWLINHRKTPQSVVIPPFFSGVGTFPFYRSWISAWDGQVLSSKSPSQVSSGTQKPLKVTVHVDTSCGTILTHTSHDFLLSRTTAFDSVLWAPGGFSLSISPSCTASTRCAVLQLSLLLDIQGLLTGLALHSKTQHDKSNSEMELINRTK